MAFVHLIVGMVLMQAFIAYTLGASAALGTLFLDSRGGSWRSICDALVPGPLMVDVRHLFKDPQESYYIPTLGGFGRGFGGQMDASMEIMADKWKTIFKVYDLNHDNIVDRDDLRIQENIYTNLYSLKGIKADRMKKKLSKYWECITLDELEHGLSKEQFVARRMEAYGKNKARTVKKIKKCFDEFVEEVVDHNKDGFISVKEMYTVLKGLNKGNRKLAKQQHAVICPDEQKRCPVEKVSDFYAELHIGNNKEKYQTFKHGYEEVGMPLEDLVE